MNCANHPDRERFAFCQNCGKALCVECSRTVGQAVFCEPCLAARLAGTTPFAGNPGARAGAGTSGFSGTIPPPSAPGEPNPGLAALLGFIPGVGAFYNGQYAKGVVHLVVFAVLVSLAGDHPVFGLFIAGWIFYQVIEAHHTARARRDGTPLPNPFGLNDIGERMGFGKAWPSAGQPTYGGYTAPPPTAGPPTSAVPPASADPGAASAGAASYGSNWGGPAESYAPPVPPTASREPEYGSSWERYAQGQPYVGVPPADSYAAAPPLEPLPGALTPRKLPTGAFVLIGLGVFFLVANTGHFTGVAFRWFVPFLIIGFGVWSFVRRMTNTGFSLSDDGSAAYRLRLYNAARSALWPILVGLLLLLDMTNVLTWSRSWPLLIVLAGVLALLRRAAYAAILPAPFAGMPTAPVGPAPTASASATTSSMVPVTPSRMDETTDNRS